MLSTALAITAILSVIASCALSVHQLRRITPRGPA